MTITKVPVSAANVFTRLSCMAHMVPLNGLLGSGSDSDEAAIR